MKMCSTAFIISELILKGVEKMFGNLPEKIDRLCRNSKCVNDG